MFIVPAIYEDTARPSPMNKVITLIIIAWTNDVFPHTALKQTQQT